MNVDFCIYQLSTLREKKKIDQLMLLKELLPILEAYKNDLQQDQIQHLLKYAPAGRGAVEF